MDVSDNRTLIVSSLEMRRTDLMDKGQGAFKAKLDALRSTTPERRFQLMVELSEVGRQMRLEGRRQLRIERAKSHDSR